MSTTFRIQLPPFSQGECPQNLEDLRTWLESARVEGTAPVAYSTGSKEPAVEDRDKPWLRTTSSGIFLGWYIWDKALAEGCGGWRCLGCRVLGELKTVVRTHSTVTKDRENKGLTLAYGWQLADENSAKDLTENSGFFVGIGEFAEVYTLIRIG